MRVPIPGSRDVRAVLDRASAAEPPDDGPRGTDGTDCDATHDDESGRDRDGRPPDDADRSPRHQRDGDDAPRDASDAEHGLPDAADACVVACPPHPQHGGSRTDSRLRAISDALCERGIDCLRFDYGPWAEGEGERQDASAALRWADDRYDRVGIAGYSFGGSLAILAAADGTVGACATLAPASSLGSDDLDAVAALETVACPVQVVYGSRDGTVDAAAVATRLRALADAAPDAGHAVEELRTDHFFVGFQQRAGESIASFLATRL